MTIGIPCREKHHKIFKPPCRQCTHFCQLVESQFLILSHSVSSLLNRLQFRLAYTRGKSICAHIENTKALNDTHLIAATPFTYSTFSTNLFLIPMRPSCKSNSERSISSLQNTTDDIKSRKKDFVLPISSPISFLVILFEK